MHDNEVHTFTLDCNWNVPAGIHLPQGQLKRSHSLAMDSLLCMILKADMKKIEVAAAYDNRLLIVKKNNNALVPWDPPGGRNSEFPLKTTIFDDDTFKQITRPKDGIRNRENTNYT